MATQPYTIIDENRHTTHSIVVRWTLSANDDGVPFDGVEFPDKTVQVTGTFNSAAVTIQGSNEVTSPSNWSTLTDPLGNNLSFTANGLKAVMENPYWIRPTSGNVSSITVTLVCSQSRK